MPQPVKNLILLGSKYPKATKTALLQTASQLGYQFIPSDIAPFKSQERFCELKAARQTQFIHNKDDIAGSRVHLIMSMNTDPNKFTVDILDTIETLKEYGAQTVHVIMPFAPYGRQDRRFEGRMVSIMAKTFAKHLKCAGADQITTFDVHSKAAEGYYTQYFGEKNVRFLSTAPEIVKAIKKANNNNLRQVIGAPDGADKPNDVAQINAREVCKMIHGDDCVLEDNMFGIIKKHTSVNETEVVDFVGDVEGAEASIFDDMTDTASTLKKAAKVLKTNKAARVNAAVGAGFLSGNSTDIITRKEINGEPNPIDHFYVTDSILGTYKKYHRLPEEQKSRMTIVRTAPIIQQALAYNF